MSDVFRVSVDDALRSLGVDKEQGLSEEQAAKLLAEHGPNELPAEEGKYKQI